MNPSWRSQLIGSLKGQLQVATYIAVLLGFTGATTTGLWLSNQTQIRLGEAELTANGEHMLQALVDHNHLGQGRRSGYWDRNEEEHIRQKLRNHSSVRSTLWIELSDGRLILPVDSHIPIPTKLLMAAMANHDEEGQVRMINFDGVNYLTSLHQSFPTGERLWSSARATDTGRIQNEFLSWMMLIGVTSMLLSLITVTLLVKRIVRPLLELSERSASLTADTLNQGYLPTAEAAPKEVRQLANTYDELMKRLASSWNDQRRFVSAVSHELRTPITIIQGYLHRTLKRSQGLTDQERRGLKTAEEETIRMRMLLDDLLNLARIDSGQLQLNQELVDIWPLLLKIADLSRINQIEHRIEVINNIPEDEAGIALADPDRLKQVLLDLIDNAAKYSPKNTLIEIQLQSDLDGIFINVKDEGIGIPEDELSYIFERFYRAKNSSYSSGTGLGLSVVSLLTSAMGGEITVQSKEGKGSCFSIILPKPPEDSP